MFGSVDELWGLYNQEGGAEVLGDTSDQEAEIIIRVLVHEQREGKENWCMGILEYVRPALHDFIASWTGGDYEDIRHAQESGAMPKKLEELISNFFEVVHLLPIILDEFVHYSKDVGWAKRYQVGDTFTLNSFMGCAAKGSKFVHASDPRIFFLPSQQARYLGALTTTPPEREVLIMPGATFKVLHMEGGAIYVGDNL
ncbi:hypothetical protein ACTAB1_18415 [Pseudomonas fragariae (ex Marin et al. 2024)]|nr:hypothetical protein [Pseudomonas syringae]POD19344.1 hypothetical protein BKM12_12345 [Pseudomonas syringae pv. syringae]UQB18693.1 hypothetical protein I9H08_17265 [Pseudomonas syringae pv. syringae]